MGTSKILRFLILCWISFAFPRRISTDVFSSTAQLQKLHDVEEELSVPLSEYIHSSLSDLSRLKAVLKNMRETSSLMKTKASYSGETVLYYVFLERGIRNLNTLRETLARRQKEADFFRYELVLRRPRLPKEELHGVSDSLIRLQSIYNLNATKLSQGHIPTLASLGPYSKGTRLSAVDTYHLGRIAYTAGSMHSAKIWMQETLRLMGTQDTLAAFSETVHLSDVLNHLAYAYYMEGEWDRSLAIYRQLAEKEPSNELFQNNLRRIMDKINIDTPSREIFADEGMIEYASLCQAHETEDLNKRPTASLTCQYLKDHPRLLLRPVAMERLSIRPSIVQFHDVLTEKEIEKIIQLATPNLAYSEAETRFKSDGLLVTLDNETFGVVTTIDDAQLPLYSAHQATIRTLERAGVNNLETGQMEIVNYRVSKTAWLPDQTGEVIRRLSLRAEALTGLSQSTAEDLQVNNYGLAGHYEPHYDFAVNMSNSPLAELGTGNRMATIMFYLSDVEVGGDTVFINPGIRVAPKKGSALFWYNLMASGRGDWDTLHAGCPVIAGSKWVANKWFHERGQEFRRPCRTEEYA